jgi:hypothetical protein
VRTPDPAKLSVSVTGSVGKTPHIVLPKLSAALGRTIAGEAEFLNPGGSVKVRAAKGIVDDAEATGRLRPGGTIVEGTGRQHRHRPRARRRGALSFWLAESDCVTAARDLSFV